MRREKQPTSRSTSGQSGCCLHLMGLRLRCRGAVPPGVSPLLMCPVTDGTFNATKHRNGQHFPNPGPGLSALPAPILPKPSEAAVQGTETPRLRFSRLPSCAGQSWPGDPAASSSHNVRLPPKRAGQGGAAQSLPEPWSWTPEFSLPQSGSCAPHSTGHGVDTQGN